MNETEIIRYNPCHLNDVFTIIRKTIKTSYANHYSQEAIRYFLDYHSPHNVSEDALHGYSIVLLASGKIIGTGTLLETNIRRVFILPEFQGKGLGKLIMSQLENQAKQSGLKFVDLHASLPAKKFYDSLSYKTLKYCKIPLKNSSTLDYYRMAKMTAHDTMTTKWNLNERRFRIVQNDGAGTNVDGDTSIIFYQKDEMVMGVYSGRSMKEGELIGFIDGDYLSFDFEQTNTHDEQYTGKGNNKIEMTKDGKIRLIDSREPKSKTGLNIFEEI